jgi:hypothetical protein
MKGKFILYALVVTFLSTVFSWGSMVGASTSAGGSTWSSHSRGGYSGGFSGGGGHK